MMTRRIWAGVAWAAWDASERCYNSRLPGSDWLEDKLVNLARWCGRWK